MHLANQFLRSLREIAALIRAAAASRRLATMVSGWCDLVLLHSNKTADQAVKAWPANN